MFTFNSLLSISIPLYITVFIIHMYGRCTESDAKKKDRPHYRTIYKPHTVLFSTLLRYILSPCQTHFLFRCRLLPTTHVLALEHFFNTPCSSFLPNRALPRWWWGLWWTAKWKTPTPKSTSTGSTRTSWKWSTDGATAPSE